LGSSFIKTPSTTMLAIDAIVIGVKKKSWELLNTFLSTIWYMLLVIIHPSRIHIWNLVNKT
jgi:hypothetical protein